MTVIPSSDKAKSTALYLPVRRSAAKFLKRRQVSPDTVIAKRNPRENYFRRKKTWFVCMTLFLNWKTGWNLCAYNRKKLRAIWNFMKKNAILKLVFGSIHWSVPVMYCVNRKKKLQSREIRKNKFLPSWKKSAAKLR